MCAGKNTSKSAQILCPWWICFTFDNPIRKMFQKPERILRPYIKEGYKILDVGPGMGYFTIPMARLVGESGQVIAADLQTKMLEGIHRRAVRAGVQDRVVLHQSSPDKLGVDGPLDFALSFWMMHEVTSKAGLIADIRSVLKPGSLFLLAEPKLHVTYATFAHSVEIAQKAGFKIVERPSIFITNAVLLRKE
ncbi:MAG TPA: class I SAM-dependent methyltransferase [Dehalococcoidales bacterium]|nr:class I SAM-dependent methyltransferase [Dehalococcoidales bacterium]